MVSAHEAASGIQLTADIALREREEECHRAVKKKRGAQESAAFPTRDDRLVVEAKKIVDKVDEQKRHGIKAQQVKLIGLLK